MIDEIGKLYTGSDMALYGYHVNTLRPVPEWAAWAVAPSTPRRVFAGVPTYFYTFATESEFIAQRAAAGLAPPEGI